MIIIAGGYQTNNTNVTVHDKTTHMRFNPQGDFFKSAKTPIFERNQTYRFRILNGEFDAIFSNLRFVAGCPKTDESYNFSQCKYTLKLSVIGADSTLFDKPVNDV